MKRDTFFTLPDGRIAELVQLRLADGFGIDVTNYGGCLTALYTPDHDGKLTDVVLGWKNPADYLENPGYLGALIGRIPNRISGGRFVLDGNIYQMCLNDKNTSALHGGFGFSHRLWEITNVSGTALTLSLFSPHGDSGFPGDLQLEVTCRILADHTLELEYSAHSNRVTVADFTNHAYFNLDGESAGSTSGHRISIKADRVTETDQFLQPTGKLIDVSGTRFDLRLGKRFSEIFREHDGGFDDNFVLGDQRLETCRENAAVVTAGKSGIRMAVHTTQPGIQFYMGGFLNNSGKSFYGRNSGFCLETQHWPDAVNHAHFPSVRLEPGQQYHSITRYSFSTVDPEQLLTE